MDAFVKHFLRALDRRFAAGQLAPADFLALERDALEAAELHRTMRPKWTLRSNIEHAKPATVARGKLHTTQQMTARQVASTCSLCKKPNKARDHGWWHMLALRRVKQQRAASVYWHRVGYDVMWKKSVAVRYQKAIARRTAIFRALAPDAAQVLGPEGIERFINRYRHGRLRYMCPIERFKNAIRRTYPR